MGSGRTCITTGERSGACGSVPDIKELQLWQASQVGYTSFSNAFATRQLQP